MSEREHVTGGESAAVGGLATRRKTEDRPFSELGLSLGEAEDQPKTRKRRRSAKLVLAPESFLDVPLQARSLERLSAREGTRYWRARALLAKDGGVQALLRADMPMAGLGVYEALLEQSWAIRTHDPRTMVHLAEAAVEVAQGFRSRGYGSKRVADLEARAWGELANAYRVGDRLRSSQDAFGQAYALLLKGTGDPYLKTRLLDLESSLLGVLREYFLAQRRLSTLSELYRGMGETHLAGRAAIKQALYTYYSGEVGEADQLNAQGMALIDRERDPILYMMAVHNHLLFLTDLGEYRRAKRILFDNQRQLLYRGRIGALRFRGLEGQINFGLGKLLSAEIAFREQRDGLVEAGMTFYSALASLHLAMVLLSQDRLDEAEAEVIVAREIFLAHGIYREYLGSVIYLEECFRRREATAEMIEMTVAYLRRKMLEVEPYKLRS